MAIIMIKSTLKVMLARREMTQKQLCEVTGIRAPTISALATSQIKHIPMDVLDRICAVLNCQPGDILEWINDSQE